MKTLIRNAIIVNEGKTFPADILIYGERIQKIESPGKISTGVENTREIDAEGSYLIPGIIDDQVHFRSPGGLFYKADCRSEALAGLTGGVTSWMDMHNIVPPTVTWKMLEKKYQIAERISPSNFSYYMGVANDNYDDVMNVVEHQLNNVCGLKIFMGSSTGNLLVDDSGVLAKIFQNSGNMLIATHCEDESTIQENQKKYVERFVNKLSAEHHPLIRNEKACYLSSAFAIYLAKTHNSRLHVFHISTAIECNQFDNSIPLEKKRITAEGCVHHLWFSSEDYQRLGNKIKCNPAIKSPTDRDALMEAVLNDYIDVIATDHAPHTLYEKNLPYEKAPSGVPTIEHSFYMMYAHVLAGKITLEKVVEKMCHNPAIAYKIADRGFIREGYAADMFLFDKNGMLDVQNRELDNPHATVHAKCGWSPFHGSSFKGKVTHTFVNGHLAYHDGIFDESKPGKQLLFKRD